jgi:Flp pilus assembly pilin Flp
MTKIQSFVTNLLRDRRGQDLIEYALLVGFAAACAASCLPAVAATGMRLGEVMQGLVAAINKLTG